MGCPVCRTHFPRLAGFLLSFFTRRCFCLCTLSKSIDTFFLSNVKAFSASRELSNSHLYFLLVFNYFSPQTHYISVTRGFATKRESRQNFFEVGSGFQHPVRPPGPPALSPGSRSARLVRTGAGGSWSRPGRLFTDHLWLWT